MTENLAPDNIDKNWQLPVTIRKAISENQQTAHRTDSTVLRQLQSISKCAITIPWRDTLRDFPPQTTVYCTILGILKSYIYMIKKKIYR
jgi:hypothetical protein